MRRSFILSIVITLAVALTGCGGRAQNHALPPQPGSPIQSAGKQKITFTIDVPKSAGPTLDNRSPQYLSPATQSIAIAITGPTTVTATTNLTIGSSGCTGSLASTVCTLTVPGLAPGSYTATLTTYDQTGGAGKILSAAQAIPFTITAGQNNAINITLSGVPASTLVLPANSTSSSNGSGGYDIIGQGAHPFAVESLDADGNIIAGPGAPLFSIGTPSGALSGVITSPSTTAVSAPNSFTVTPPTKFAIGTASFTVTPTFAGQATNGCAQAGANCAPMPVTIDMKYSLLVAFVDDFDGHV